MSTNLEINKLLSQYDKAFNSPSTHKHLAQMLMFRFLSEIEKITDERNISRKELAKKIDVSASYITQLYRGSKPLNIETLAKIEQALDFRFEVKAVDKELLEIHGATEDSWDEDQINSLINRFTLKNGFFIYKKKANNNTYSSIESLDDLTEIDYKVDPEYKTKMAS